MDYIIKKTDYSLNGQFTIKPYTTNGPALPTQAVPLDEHAVSANTSLILLGKGMFDYGDIIATDFVHLLENFAGPVEPVYPIQGQLWFKNSTGELLVYNAGSFTDNSIVINGKLVANLNVNTKRIVNLGTPIDPTDATTKGYVDTTFVPFSGGTMLSGANLTFVTGEVLGLPNVPSVNSAATSKKYVDDTNTATQAWATSSFLPLAGGTLTGNLVMNSNQHIYMATPIGGFTLANDVVNKDYVDTTISSTSVFVKKVGDTMTGSLAVDGSALYNGPSYTVVSSTAASNQIEIAGGDLTATFISGLTFYAVLDSTIYPSLTVLSSAFNSGPNTTTITVSNDITTTASSGSISRIFGIALSSASLYLDGDLVVQSGNAISFGYNKLTQIDTPTLGHHAATKDYVDNAISSAITMDGTLATVTFLDNTLTFSSTVGSPITVSGVAAQEHTHVGTDVFIDGTSRYVPNSLFRSTLATSLSSYPHVSLQTALETLDEAVGYSTYNDRYIFPVVAQNVTAVSTQLSSDLTVIAVTTGVGGTFTVSGGDFTSTFVNGIEFTLFGNTGFPTNTVFQTSSSVYNSGPNTTTITVIDNVPVSTTGDGFIQRIYGAFKFVGDIVQKYSTNIRVRLIGNSGTIDADYTLERNSRDPAHTFTWLYMNSTAPLPVPATASGYILPYSILMPEWSFLVEGHKLMVYRQGIKQYANTRGYSEIEIEDAVGSSSTILPWYPTPIPTGSYSFNIQVNGGAINTVTLNVLLTPYTITNVDTINDLWTVSGAPPDYFKQFSTIQVVGNTGIGSMAQYTIREVVYNGLTTDIYVNEDIISTADISGGIQYAYSYGDMIDDMQIEITTLYPGFLASPIVILHHSGRLRFYSHTTGTGSSVVITDVDLFANWADVVIDNKVVGATYGYSESGVPFNTGGIIELDYLPTIGEVYEFINIR